MADWSFPILTSLYTDLITLFKGRDEDCAKMFDGVTASNLPLNTIRWSSANSRFEKWDNLVWSELTSSYNINVTTFNGQISSFYRNISNMNAGSLPAARFSDVSHGARAGGSLHSVATTVTHGFMSSSDKSKLNGVENNATADQTKADIDALGIAAATADSISGLNTVLTENLAIGEQMTTANVNNAIAGTALGSVGSYAFLTLNAQTAPGITQPGSALRYSGSANDSYLTVIPTGTWKALGWAYGSAATLWVRIS